MDAEFIPRKLGGRSVKLRTHLSAAEVQNAWSVTSISHACYVHRVM
jgi:hypothetical protein